MSAAALPLILLHVARFISVFPASKLYRVVHKSTKFLNFISLRNIDLFFYIFTDTSAVP